MSWYAYEDEIVALALIVRNRITGESKIIGSRHVYSSELEVSMSRYEPMDITLTTRLSSLDFQSDTRIYRPTEVKKPLLTAPGIYLPNMQYHLLPAPKEE